MKRAFFLLVPLLLFQLIAVTASSAALSDVKLKPEDLGQPFTVGTYARNVWDMQIYNGKIYLGHGDSVSNAGPISVIYFDPKKGIFVNEYNTNEDQINNYEVINEKLYIPGYDPRESWNLGNFYVRETKNWVKNRTIPTAVHTFDMVFYKDKLYAATASNGFGEVLSSSDNGLTWKSLIPKKGTAFISGAMARALFEFNGKLYASSVLYNSNTDLNNLLCIDGSISYVISGSKVKLIPDSLTFCPFKMARTLKLNNTLFYITSQVLIKEPWIPDCMYAATDIDKAKVIKFQETNIKPVDMISRGSTLYILAYLKADKNHYTNIVYKTDEALKTTELFRFNKDTFARSFEELDGDFYFGLGCYKGVLPDSTGRILRVKKSIWQSK